MEFLIFQYDKNYFGLEKLEQKRRYTERALYECLYELFKEEDIQTDNNYDYFLTSYKKKQTYGLSVKFYLRRKNKNTSFDDTHSIETLKGIYNLEGEEHIYLKKYSKNKVLGIKRTEYDNIVYFYVVVEDQRIKPNIIILSNECNVCYDTNKETYKDGFFKCNHNELCLECYSKLIIKRCPICRKKLPK
jgi:hypothetical protein